MRKLWKTGAILLLMSPLFIACDDDENYYLNNNWKGYGNLEKQENLKDLMIRRDDGCGLIIKNGILPSQSDKEGKRIYAEYTILGNAWENNNSLDAPMDYYIQLNYLREVLCKTPVKESFIQEDAEHRNDSIGNDPINVGRAWFGGKYLNIEFKFPAKENSGTRHFINIVQDDITTHNDSVYITFRHNAYGETPDKTKCFWNYGQVSFDLSSIVPEGKTSVPVKLIWTEYNNNATQKITRSDSGTYSLKEDNNTPKSTTGLNRGNASTPFADQETREVK